VLDKRLRRETAYLDPRHEMSFTPGLKRRVRGSGGAVRAKKSIFRGVTTKEKGGKQGLRIPQVRKICAAQLNLRQGNGAFSETRPD